MATSEFAWLLGDDDTIFKGSLEKIISILESSPDCELLLLNAMLTDNDLRPRDTQFHLDRDITLTDCNDVLAHHSDKLTFGMMIINSRLFNSTDADRFIGTAHYYGGVVYEYLANNFVKHQHNCIVILKEPMVYLRQGERRWTHEMGDISVRQIPEFFTRMAPCYEENARKALNRAVGSYRTILPLIRLRAEGWLDSDKERELYAYYINVRFRFLAISRMPIFIARILSVVGVNASRYLKRLKSFVYNNLKSKGL